MNYLADVFSRAFSSSRFLDKTEYALSKSQANQIPTLTEPFLATESALYQYFTLPLHAESGDKYPRKKAKISTPKPISSLYKLFQDSTPEEKYLSAIRLLQGWDDPSLADSENNSCQLTVESPTQDKDRAALQAVDIMLKRREDLFKLYSKRVIQKTMRQLYGDLDSAQQKRLEATLKENHRNLFRENLITTMKEDFLAFEKEKDSVQANMLEPCRDDISVRIKYSVIHPSCFHPSKQENSPGIDIPVQQEITLPPNGQMTIDTGIQLVLPANLCAQLIPTESSSKVNLYIHSGFVDSNFSSTIKLLLRNDSPDTMKIEQGTSLVQAIILPVLHPTLIHESSVQSYSVKVDDSRQPEIPSGFEKDDLSNSSLLTSAYEKEGTSVALNKFQLSALPPSYIHMMAEEKVPSCMNILEMNSTIILPNAAECRDSIFADLKQMESEIESNIQKDHLTPISFPNPNSEMIVQNLNRNLMNQTVYLHSTVSTLKKDPKKDESLAQSLQDSAYKKVCEKLAVISVDLIKDQTMTKTMLAQTQQADDYLSTVRDKVGTQDNPFPNFFIKNQVLYKKYLSPNSLGERHVICLPDILLPSVIHSLHVNLGHASFTVTKRNFEQYYYNHKATKTVKSYVQSCVTCALSHKFDIKKTVPETSRSLVPNRPRQYIYCDLIPMYAGIFSYILFCLDAYSQYIYAIPVKDKTAASCLQGFLSLCASTGWPEALYMDNESSFQKTAKLLVKMAPIKVLYSTPYCQFQNWSENYIKNFKKSFIKLLNDAENPQDNADWPLLLPTVTQALNRQLIPNVGLTREAIHFNMDTDFYPLAHLSSEAESDIDKTVNSLAADAFKVILQKRKTDRARKRQVQVPLFYETQLVFMRDQAPSISTILKIPNKGPYRIEKLEDRNVTLTEIGTGKTVHSHIQNIRPLEISEFRLILSKGWDLNVHLQKANLPKSKPGIFDFPEQPEPAERIIEIERQHDRLPEEGDLENLFQNPVPTNGQEEIPVRAQAPPALHAELPPAEPPDIPEDRPPVLLRRSPRDNPSTRRLDAMHMHLSDTEDEITENECDLGEQTLSVNTVDIHLEISSMYKASMENPEVLRKYSLKVQASPDLPSVPKPSLKKRKILSFYLPKIAPYIFYPGQEENTV